MTMRFLLRRVAEAWLVDPSLPMAEQLTDYKPVPVSEARRIAATYSKSMVVILCYDAVHALTHTTTYGESAFEKERAAAVGKLCAETIGSDLSKTTCYEDFHRDYDPARYRELQEACRALFDAEHYDHFAARMSDSEMAALVRIKTLIGR